MHMVVLWSRINADENAGENESLLSYAERARAARFATDDLRRRYVAAHAFVRRALAAHTGADAAALRFDAGAFGKPQLIDFPQVHFNLSHSGDWALCVISDDGPVGVDIEVVRPLDEHDDLAARFFPPLNTARWSLFQKSNRSSRFSKSGRKRKRM